MNAALDTSRRINLDFSKFINDEVLPLTGLDADEFWNGFFQLISDLAPVNQSLLDERDQLQKQIDQWHQAQNGKPFSQSAYQGFLQQIGYLTEPCPDFKITTQDLDEEISTIAGPQLVVPVDNARFALNAANARWGSLYDALYGTDMISMEGELAPGKEYNKARGDQVIASGREFLDTHFPLVSGSHKDVTKYQVTNQSLQAILENGDTTGLQNNAQFVAFNGELDEPTAIVLKNNGLHVELEIDANGPIGRNDRAGINNINLESALTSIMDCEDSVAAVDAEDKIRVYRNWLGLMQGNLEATLDKGGKSITRKLNEDKTFQSALGGEYTLKGRALMLVRNVGHLMKIDLIQDEQGNDIPEGIIDAVVTSLIATLDLAGKGAYQNSKTGSIYIVKPKMHGPKEVRFTCELFSRVEDLLKLPGNTLKVGIMDEERRTTVNLKACISESRDRVFFINTGFLDRTGDEIHTSMCAGPFLPKAAIKSQPWITAYEAWNVDMGLTCGFKGRAQIGKGMWAMPDEMLNMVTQKIAHPRSGANTAWVPSPTAATLHATHYHLVNVGDVQQSLLSRPCASLDDILTIPLLQDPSSLTSEDIERELENNIQGILGYVVRWVGQGIGCSKVPDINNVGLMEDRATLRISSQHIANWLLHKICTEEQVMAVMERMAVVVDGQNAGDPSYQNMAPDLDQNIAFQAAKALIFEGTSQPNGYTEPLLHSYRRKAKAQLS